MCMSFCHRHVVAERTVDSRSSPDSTSRWPDVMCLGSTDVIPLSLPRAFHLAHPQSVTQTLGTHICESPEAHRP